MTALLFSSGVGLLLAASYAASPLTMWVLLAAPVVGWLAARHLPADERRLLFALLGAAFAARLAFIGAQFLIGLPHHNQLAVGALGGDESYYLSRALRSRDLMLGFTGSKYDFFVANDDYGRTSYLGLLTAMQVVFGPTPYGMKVLNALLFMTGAALLFRMVRPAFGLVPALLGLSVLLFLPSLFVSSVSLLKESLYFLVTSALAISAVASIRSAAARRWRAVAGAMAIAAASLWLMNDLRRGALVIGIAGLGLGVAIHVTARSWWRVAAAAGLVLVAGAFFLWQPGWQARALGGITTAAKMHAGHVFTVGHAYKLLDENFYKNPASPDSWDLTLTAPQAGRFLARAAASVLVTPWPWEMRSTSELAFMPEHVVWYLIVLLTPIGAVAGWKRDPLVTSLLIGFAVTAAAVLAVSTGNVGTLLRLRGLVTPYLIWLAALGLCTIGDSLVAARAPRPVMKSAAL
ncbi:MAG: hypothetical protein Q8O42_02145 [Acidobacteriota bacterium]|nr:hypothetical protein [Acidobacteriota bacterium]